MSAQTELYDSVFNDVVALTARPDLETETALAIRTATQSMHSRYLWPRDSVVQLVKFTNATNVVALDIPTLFPRLRGISTLQGLDVNFAPVTSPENFIEIVELGDIKDPLYGQLKNNIAYIAGTNLNVRSYAAIYGVLVEYFQLPVLSRDRYLSWIAQLAPDIIVYKAASIVLSTNGNEEKASAYAGMVEKQLLPELVSNYLTSAAR
jgi:hypothetical protein